MSDPVSPHACEVVTVTLNPAIDRTVEIHNFIAGRVNRAESVHDHPGGKGVNVAAALADAGHTVSVTGFLGRENAASFEQMFAQKRIDDAFVRIDGQTRVGIKIIDPAMSATTDINFPGAAPSPADAEALLAALGQIHAPWAVLSGSLPPGVDEGIYRDLIRVLKGRGCRVVLDTSGPPLRHALAARPSVIKPNIQELEDLLGRMLATEEAILAAAHELIVGEDDLVVVSLGPDGALFVTAHEAVRAAPPDVPVLSTVGAGDAMVAGIVAGHLRGLPLPEVARLSTAFSVDAISKLGAGLSAPAVIDALAAQVVVDVVARY